VIPELSDQQANRYDKFAIVYRAGIVLGAPLPWLRS
jgi:hypothetical protein